MTTQDPLAALGRFLRRTGGLTVRVEDGREYVRVPSEWIDDLAAALAATPPAIDRKRLACEKCGNVDLGVVWHEGGWASGKRRSCGYGDTAAVSGEHLHYHCRRCSYDFVAAIIAAYEADR